VFGWKIEEIEACKIDVLCPLKNESKWNRSFFTTDSQSVCLGIEHPCGTCDQILLPVGMLLPEVCGLVSMGRLL
jgi:hypothetical protein